MKTPRRLITLVFIGAFFLASYFFYKKFAIKTITIYHTNDVHGHILPSKGVGGSAILASFLKMQKKPYLLLDSGDVFQGTPEGDLPNGEAVIKIMNELDYDAMTVGNHEFDKGQPQLKKLVEMANFSVLGANVIDKRTRTTVSWLDPYFIKEVSGLKIGILGLTTSAAPYITMPDVLKGLGFQKEIEAAKKFVPELRQKVDIVIALTHIGVAKNREFDDDVFLAENVEGIDVIIGGHTHTFLEKPRKVKNTVIVQAGCNGKAVGELKLQIRNNKIVGSSYELITLTKKKFGEDKELKRIIDNFTKSITGRMALVIGSSAQSLTRSFSDKTAKNGELPLGNLVADVFREAAAAEIAFHNIGGIRADLPKGNVTIRNIYEMSPFTNKIITMKLSGVQIKEILEKSVSGKFGKLQVSGLKFQFDINNKAGEQVTEIKVNGKDIKPKKYYQVATNSFLAKGGDMFSTFRKGREIVNTGIIDRDAVVAYFKNHSPVKAQIEGRIINITK